MCNGRPFASSPFRRLASRGHRTPGKCSPRSPHTCVGGEMLFNRLEYNKSGGMGTRAFTFLTAVFDAFLGIREGLLDLRFLRNLPGKESTTTSLGVLRTTTSSVSKTLMGKMSSSKLFRYQLLDSGYMALSPRTTAHHSALATVPEAADVLTGDLNICESEEGRLNVWNQTFTEGDGEGCPFPYQTTIQRHVSLYGNRLFGVTRANAFRVGCPHIPFSAQFWNRSSVADFKNILEKARRKTVHDLLFKTLDSLGAKLLTASTALRAYRNRHLDTLMHCCEAWGPIGKCFDQCSFECIDFQVLSQNIASLTKPHAWKTCREREAEIGNFLWTQTEKDNVLTKCRLGLRAWRSKKPMLCLHSFTDEDGHPLRMKTNRAGGCANIGVRFLRRALKASDTTAMRLFCVTFRRLLMTYVWKSTEMNLTSFWPKKRNPLRALMGFRIASTGALEAWAPSFSTKHTYTWLRVAKFQRNLPRAELYLFPNPPTSITMAVFWDRLMSYVCWRSMIGIARFSSRRFAEAFNGILWDVYIHLRDVYLPGKWQIIFSRLKQLPKHMLRALPWISFPVDWYYTRVYQRQSILDFPCARESRITRVHLPFFAKDLLRQHHTRGICRNDPRTIPHGQGREAMLSSERLSIGYGFRPNLPLAPGRDHPKELCCPWLSPVGFVCVCWRLRSGCLIFLTDFRDVFAPPSSATTTLRSGFTNFDRAMMSSLVHPLRYRWSGQRYRWSGQKIHSLTLRVMHLNVNFYRRKKKTGQPTLDRPSSFLNWISSIVLLFTIDSSKFVW